jgi:hypothetical protein
MHKVTIEIVSKHQNQEFKCKKTPHFLFIHEKLVLNYAISVFHHKSGEFVTCSRQGLFETF